MNKVVLIGRLTADPELRQTQSGVSSCKFTVAVNRKFKNDPASLNKKDKPTEEKVPEAVRKYQEKLKRI